MSPALTLAIGDLADRRILAILLRSLLLTLLIFAALGSLAVWALQGVDPCGWIGDDSCPLGLAGGSFGALALIALAIWLLFPAVALGVISAYMDRVISVVEARHYPQAAAAARPMGIARGAWLGLASALRVLLYNLIALPFYLLLLVTGIGPLILFVIVNGAAFGHDLGAMVALRHGDRISRRAWLRATRGDRWAIGAAMTALFLVPIVNLIAPILGAAAITHLHNRRTRFETLPSRNTPL
ncbi:uncharacterized protein involved in cysteine biosynthesis [Sphingomonas vulcanisoli]|uniref:Uncharacterized protein involved in cysteine biosynthesis n=1 Tax=Sphingomonas vulcanisoli TaxID=1658060 RepID=A0ABX0TXG4_9SPHN|nr:EI24 domain-containing protein [Sphingomonas vulcanisoli]NIJ08336.1 uncharacterized protein involved in cysteine biosynthesis [Sphingomonas vulcanisoli]